MKKNIVTNHLNIIAVFAGLLLMCYPGLQAQTVLNPVDNQIDSVRENRDSIWKYVEAPEAIEKAKIWYAANCPEGVFLDASDGKQMQMRAEWSQAFATQYDSLEVVETNIMTKGRILFLDPEVSGKYNETHDPKYMQCYTRLVFKTNRTTGITVGCLMTVIPNLEWLEKSNFKPFMEVTYLFRSKDFGGMIWFHNLDGSFSNGWKYEKGKIVASIKSMDAANPIQFIS